MPPRRSLVSPVAASTLKIFEVRYRTSSRMLVKCMKPRITTTRPTLKRGQFIHYSLVRDNLVNTLNGYVQEVCPVSKPLKRESKARAAGR